MMPQFLAGSSLDPFSLLVIDTLAQVTAITLMALLVMRTIARRSPAARHGIALCALFCVFSSPAIAGGVERVGGPNVGSLIWSAPTASAPDADVEELLVTRQARSIHPVTAALILCWSLGVMWQIVRFGAGCIWLVRLRRSVSALGLEDRSHVLDEVRRATGRRRMPVIAVSPLLSGPVVLGPFRPMIVLPTGMNEMLEDAALRDILIHECAHLVQNHHVLGCAQRWVALLFWPHPLVHALCRELEQSAEELCDNFVLRQSEAPQYARTLLTVATSGQSESTAGNAVAPCAARHSPRLYSVIRRLPVCRRPRTGRLMARVEGLLDRTRERRTQWDLWKQVVLTSLFLAIATSVSAVRVSQAAGRPEFGPRMGSTRPIIGDRVRPSLKGRNGVTPLERTGVQAPPESQSR